MQIRSKLLPLLFFIAAGSAQADCALDTLRGAFATVSKLHNIGDNTSTALIGRIVFDGSGAISRSNFSEGADGRVRDYTGNGTYTLAANCIGSGIISLRADGTVFGSFRLNFVVGGTPQAPSVSAMISDAADATTGIAVLTPIDF